MVNVDKIKKRWLIAAALSTFLGSLSIVLDVIFTSPHKITPQDLLGCLLVVSLGGLIMFFIPYYCAYLKQGTKLLSLQIFLIPLKFCGDIAQQINGGANMKQVLIGALLIAPIVLFYWVSSVNLRRLNRELSGKKSSNDTGKSFFQLLIGD